MYKLTATLNKLRTNAVKLSTKYLESPAEVIKADTNHFCQAKGPSGSQIVFCINNQSSKGGSYEINVGGFAANDEVVEVLGCTTTPANVDGTFTAYMFDGAPRVYTKASALEGTGICPERKPAGPKTGAASGLGVATGTLVAVAMAWTALFLA